MSKTIISENGKVIIQTNSSEQQIGQGCYDANTNITGVRHYQNGIRESATSRNLEITGNSQEVMEGRGVTCCYSIKITGTPELFSGEAQRTLDRALAKLTALMLQPGDDRHSSVKLPVLFPNSMSIVSNMTSAAQASNPLELPPVNGVADLPVALEAIGTWAKELNAKDTAEQMKHAKLLDNMWSQLSDDSSENKQGSHNIAQTDVCEAYLPYIDTIMSAQSNMC